MIMHDFKICIRKVLNKEPKDEVIRLMCRVMFGDWNKNLELRYVNKKKVEWCEDLGDGRKSLICMLLCLSWELYNLKDGG
jgi:hypothetical protein